MTRARLVLCLAAFGVLAATAGPAMAGDGSTRVCVVATHDRSTPGPASLCVWVPIDASAQH